LHSGRSGRRYIAPVASISDRLGAEGVKKQPITDRRYNQQIASDRLGADGVVLRG